MNYKIVISKVNDGNMSSKFGDFAEVMKNKKQFFELNNITNSVSLNVLYSDKITYLENNKLSREINTDCLITKQKELYLYLYFGDCIPMVVFDKQQNIISLTHLGWQSISLNLHQKVVKYYIEKLGSKIQDLEIILGPSIKKDSYILKNPKQLQISGWANYLQELNDDYYKIDLNKFVCDALTKMGIKKIRNDEVDTAKDLNFFSHYRYNYISKVIPEGRFIYGVMLEEK